MNLIKNLTTDHRRFVMILSSINSLLFGEQNAYFTQGRKPEVTGAVIELLHELTLMLIRHEEVEQKVLFPVLMERLPAMTDAVKRLDADHENSLRLFKQLEALLLDGSNNHKIIDKYLQVQKFIDMHILREETEIYEPARANIPAEELKHLGAQVEMAYI